MAQKLSIGGSDERLRELFAQAGAVGTATTDEVEHAKPAGLGGGSRGGGGQRRGRW
jgi:hypothetical protein